ncbi:hypothetical protein WK68_14795 [Burkholderia ubonensis]|uniref:hypothetical protein n=1 Tax=Burkholderia ubonensis TaxID=101571 RepID=UPI00075EE454|nr:hypothetical protein [Burkholderia ubonensis]KVU38849.1 hypothetical protein WK68_14795 [Burkholderia ubonensis]
MYAKTISMLFYLFFTCVIFNPQVSGVTIYLYTILPFLDPGFSAFLISTSRRWIVPMGIAITVCLLSSPMAAAKIVSIAVCVGYLMYTIARRIEYLHLWMTINVLFGIAQFILYYADYGLSVQLGPDEVSKMLWGDAATQTNANYYAILYFARVSGFSREAGFFASLLSASFVLYLYQGGRNRWMLMLYCLGLFVSLSKASFVLLIFAFLYCVRRQLRTVHPLASLIAFFTIMMVIALYMNQHDFFGSETFAHRLAGYPFLLDAHFSDLARGITSRQLNGEYGYLPYVSMNRDLYFIGDGTFTSIPGLFADLGLISALVLLGVFAFTASDGFVILLCLLITATVGMTTVTSFVPIAYLISYWPRFVAHLNAQRQRGQPSTLSRFVEQPRRAPVTSYPNRWVR